MGSGRDGALMAERRVETGPFRLEVVQGEDAGGVYEGAPGKKVTIGRSVKNELVLADKTVSRQHAVLEATREGFRIQDLGSTAGTKRRGQPIPAAQWVAVEDGDEIEIGLTVIRFTVPRATPARAAVAPQRAPLAAPAKPAAAKPVVAETPREEPIESFGPYEILRPLDPAGVDLAVDTRSRARVALLRVRASELGFFGRRRFLKACEESRGLEHPAILAPLDCGRQGDVVFVASPYLAGVTPEDLLHGYRRELTVELATFIAREVASGLAYLQQQRGPGFRATITAGRIVISGSGRVALRDVGVPEVAPVPAGRFLAPEEEAGKPGDMRSAVFSLGIVLYELLAREPIEVGRRTTLLNIDQVRIDVSPDLADITMRMVEVRPEGRFERTADLEAALAEELRAVAPEFGAAVAGEWVARRFRGACES